MRYCQICVVDIWPHFKVDKPVNFSTSTINSSWLGHVRGQDHVRHQESCSKMFGSDNRNHGETRKVWMMFYLLHITFVRSSLRNHAILQACKVSLLNFHSADLQCHCRHSGWQLQYQCNWEQISQITQLSHITCMSFIAHIWHVCHS